MTMKQQSNRPIRKIQAVWLSALITVPTITVLIQWLWPLAFPTFPIGPTEAAIIAGAVVGIVSGVLGWATPADPRDAPVPKTMPKEG